MTTAGTSVGPPPTTTLASNAITCYHFIVAQFLVRGVPENIAVAIKRRAKKNGRSTEAELRAILTETIKPKGGDFWNEADRLRKELSDRGLKFDSAAIIREERDKR